ASGASTYSWIAGPVTQNYIISPTVTTTYSVTGTSSIGCISNMQTKTITVNPIPLITIPSVTICSGSTGTLNAYGANTYTWSTGANTNSITDNPTITTTYSVIGASSVGCLSSSTASITIGTSPSVLVNSAIMCAGNSATLNVNGITSCTWSTGSNSNSIIVTPTANTNYTVSGNLIGCTLGSSNISTVIVNPTPILTANLNNTVCIGTSTILTANGASTFTWSTNAQTNSISVSSTITTNYTVTGTNGFGCNKTETINVTVDPNCQDVWPGDANSDGLIDNTDVLELGLHFFQSGPARNIVSNNWQAYYSNNWAGTITNGKNLNHSDCNGDGTIDQGDTLAVFNNYNLTHLFKETNTTIVNPEITISPDQATVQKGDWGTASIYLGNPTNQINIYGIAFNINFDNFLIDADSIWLEFPSSFFNFNNTNLNFRKLNFSNSAIYAASTRTNNVSINSNGQIAILHYKILSSLSSNTPLNFSITQAKKSDANGNLSLLSAGSGSLLAVGNFVGIKENKKEDLVSIYPNPNSGIINITSLINIKILEVYSSKGELLIKENLNANKHQLTFDQFANGIYYIKTINAFNASKYQKLILQK
ncbi:MAG: T9SS type A sorting domain-containing protein, partial [Bacteroidia bacterium]